MILLSILPTSFHTFPGDTLYVSGEFEALALRALDSVPTPPKTNANRLGGHQVVVPVRLYLGCWCASIGGLLILMDGVSAESSRLISAGTGMGQLLRVTAITGLCQGSAVAVM